MLACASRTSAAVENCCRTPPIPFDVARAAPRDHALQRRMPWEPLHDLAQLAEAVAALANRRRDALRECAAERRDRADRASRDPAADERLRADEDVEPL